MNRLTDELKKHGLTDRQIEAAELSCTLTGLGGKELAAHMGLSTHGFKWHMTRVYRKLTCKTRSALIVWAHPYIVEAEAPGIYDATPAASGGLPRGIS